jgi:hypothetical protein
MRRPQLAALALLAAFAAAVLALEPRSFGLPPGHHGRVSASRLALIGNAYAGNGFVGYVGRRERAPGVVESVYWNRAPFFFDALARPLVRPWQRDLADAVYWGHQLMNGIYLLTLWIAFRFLLQLTGDPTRAALAAIGALCGHYFLTYKDLVEQNRLGALAVALVLLGSARLLLRGDRRGFWLAVLPASCMGEAAPAALVLALLNALLFVAPRASGGSAGSVLVHLRSAAFAAWCASALVSAAAIAYNARAEAAARSAPLSETGIVASALRRTGAAPTFDRHAQWSEVLPRQWRSMRRGLAPEFVHALAHLDRDGATVARAARRAARAASLAIGIAGGVALALWLVRERGARRLLLCFALLSGLAYTLPMRRFAHFHDFTATYYLGSCLLFWAALLRGPPDRAPRLRAVALAAVAALSLATLARARSQETPEWQSLAREVDRARAAIGRPGPRVHPAESLLESVPAAAWLFFPDSVVTSEAARADVVVTRGRACSDGEELAPGNQRLRVFAPPCARLSAEPDGDRGR